MLSAENDKTPALPDDDLVLPFRTVKSDVIGRVIRLGSVVRRHPVAARLSRSRSATRWARRWR